MGYIQTPGEFAESIRKLRENYRIYAPVLKKGEGRFFDTDVVRYDYVDTAEEIELHQKSNYAFREVLTPLSETLFYFVEEECRAADIEKEDIIVFLRSCDLHAVKRIDDIYLHNGKDEDWFYAQKRPHIKFALIGCQKSYDNCFCVSMGTNRSENYAFSVDEVDGSYRIDVKDSAFDSAFASPRQEEVTPAYVTDNEVKVHVPEEMPKSILTHDLWKEYTSRCINCGRCNFVCPTCTCYTMQDVFYTDNGRVGERRRVAASCMVDGFTTVAGGGQYRKTNGERMRFKVMHKIYDHRKRFGYDMCVGCGRCDDVCPEYISYSNIIKKVDAAVKEAEADGE